MSFLRRPTRLTTRQAQVLDVIRSHLTVHGSPPTLREIGIALGIASTNGVSDHLEALERKGAIRRTVNSSRGIQLVGSNNRCPLCGALIGVGP